MDYNDGVSGRRSVYAIQLKLCMRTHAKLPSFVNPERIAFYSYLFYPCCGIKARDSEVGDKARRLVTFYPCCWIKARDSKAGDKAKRLVTLNIIVACDFPVYASYDFYVEPHTSVSA
ncbi:hypothetical protein SNE40_022970 [Patella caerulea]|uniref:Uncharacterized protein n=1 Tax=Patella caerulea TaxID=87958 RepID=A0AAN8G983_PATCE